jgi:hypothetical protein
VARAGERLRRAWRGAPKRAVGTSSAPAALRGAYLLPGIWCARPVRAGGLVARAAAWLLLSLLVSMGPLLLLRLRLRQRCGLLRRAYLPLAIQGRPSRVVRVTQRLSPPARRGLPLVRTVPSLLLLWRWLRPRPVLLRRGARMARALSAAWGLGRPSCPHLLELPTRAITSSSHLILIVSSSGRHSARRRAARLGVKRTGACARGRAD